MSFIVAIDGPTSSGKSTLAKNIQNQLGFKNIQTGAMHRCVAKLILDNNIEINDMQEIERILTHLDIELKDTKEGQLVLLNERDVTLEIRTKKITDFTSKVASIPIVRQTLVNMQRKMAEKHNIVIEGRDIGTNVFPNANIKIFLNASPKVRIDRKVKELKKNGEKFDFNEIAESVYNWDRDAINRGNGALKRAKDSIYIDTSNLTIDELTTMVINKIKQKYISEIEL